MLFHLLDRKNSYLTLLALFAPIWIWGNPAYGYFFTDLALNKITTAPNDLGQIIVWDTSNSSFNNWNYSSIYTIGSGYTYIKPPTTHLGNLNSFWLVDINDEGMAVGVMVMAGTPKIESFLYDTTSKELTPTGYAPDNKFLQLVSINNSGISAGNSASGNIESYRNITYTKNTGITEIGLPEGAITSFTREINESGQILSEALLTDGRVHAFIYTPGIGHTDITPDASIAHSYDMNDMGQAIITYNDLTSALYTPGIGLEELPFRAFDINNLGQIVGGNYMYSKESGLIDINSFVPQDFRFYIKEAYFINDKGEIAGIGRKFENAYEERAYLLTVVPEPSTYLLFTVGIIGLFWRQTHSNLPVKKQVMGGQTTIL